MNLLEADSLSVDYGGVHALRQVSVACPDKSVVVDHRRERRGQVDPAEDDRGPRPAERRDGAL